MIGILIVLLFLLSTGTASAKNYPVHETGHSNVHESNGAYHLNTQYQQNAQSEYGHGNVGTHQNYVVNNGGAQSTVGSHQTGRYEI